MLTGIQHIYSMKQERIKYTQTKANKLMDSANETMNKPNPENCKNCSTECAYDCAQLTYTIQHRTVLIISPLTFRQTSQLRCCPSLCTTLHDFYTVRWKQFPQISAFQQWYKRFETNFQTLYMNVLATHPANFIRITDMAQETQQFKLQWNLLHI